MQTTHVRPYAAFPFLLDKLTHVGIAKDGYTAGSQGSGIRWVAIAECRPLLRTAVDCGTWHKGQGREG